MKLKWQQQQQDIFSHTDGYSSYNNQPPTELKKAVFQLLETYTFCGKTPLKLLIWGNAVCEDTHKGNCGISLGTRLSYALLWNACKMALFSKTGVHHSRVLLRKREEANFCILATGVGNAKEK